MGKGVVSSHPKKCPIAAFDETDEFFRNYHGQMNRIPPAPSKIHDPAANALWALQGLGALAGLAQTASQTSMGPPENSAKTSSKRSARTGKKQQVSVIVLDEQALAMHEAHQILSNALARSAQPIYRMTLLDMSNQGASLLMLPRRALDILVKALSIMASGHSVGVSQLEGYIGTQEAADYLQVSRPFLVREIDAGIISCKKVGAHRRILFTDVLAYKKSLETRQAQAPSMDVFAKKTDGAPK